ncbi:MAG: alpha/beta hydrolase [Oscillospiraceae bacterium]|nr:alpha/beta hydrolase [Oscillospiraceae bacterium]MDE7172294.1 alpha/beta hydrolase [Oscillospiraceae bacterium]
MEQSIRQRRRGRIALIATAVLAVLLAGALLFAGNYLFRFALDPQFGGMIDGSQEWPLEGESAWLDENSEDRWLESRDGLKLHALYLAQEEESHKYVVGCHGYGSIPQYMGWSAAHFYELGFNILAPAARAHEQSGGRYASMGWLERLDIVDWVNTLVEQDPEAEIVLFGISMGGATVMMTAGEELPANVKCIIEDCGYSSVWDEFAGQLQEMFGLPTFPVLDAASLVTQVRAGFGFKEASAVEQLKKASLPMLFIHGEDDTFVPYAMLDVVYDACASAEKERLSVPGAGHGGASWTDPELYWATVETFLEKYVG